MRLKRILTGGSARAVALSTALIAVSASSAYALDTSVHGGNLIFVADNTTNTTNSTPVQRGANTTGDSSQPVADSVVTMKVKAALAAAKGLESRRISVKTVNGTVHLTGTVVSEEQRSQALQTVRGIEGVSSVSDGLTVGGKS